jgi:hypothetical protein
LVEATAVIPEGSLYTLVIGGSASNNTLSLNLLFDDDTTAQKPLWLLRDPASVHDRHASEQLALAIAPNPLNDGAVLRYRLASAGVLRVELFDMRGQRVAVLHDGYQTPGEHQVPINGYDLPSGTYTVRIERNGGEAVAVKQLVVVR